MTRNSHLDTLENEAIYIFREAIKHAKNPVMLYSIGKDSCVLLHLALKAFYPAPPPFPLLHIDTQWKFKEMIEFRDKQAKEHGIELITYTNPEGIENNISPISNGSDIHTDVMKTQALKQALNKYEYDVAFGGARRDEEKSRAKERVFSFRDTNHSWDAKNQRPEPWSLYNTRKNKGESIRVFPLSNWTELDIWEYIQQENIDVVPLYFAKPRPTIERDGITIMVDDDRLDIKDSENIKEKTIRFRSLGCYPLTGAIESSAENLADIISEMKKTNTSERAERSIDKDDNSSMEEKKRNGYF